MAIAGGLSAQFGMVDEVTYNTLVTVTRFLEFTQESVQQSIERIESKGLRPNRRVLATDDWQAGRIGAGGSVEFEVAGKGFGLLLKHMLGSIATSQPAVGPSPLVYEHTAKIGALDGKSFTGQFGRAGSAGTVHPFTYGGVKIADWELACAVNELLTLKTTFDAASEVTGTALASASYASSPNPLLAFVGGTISIGGVATAIKQFSLKGDNGLKQDRYFMRGATSQVKKEQLEGAQIREVGGSLTGEFEDLTAYQRFVNGTVGALTLFFSGTVIQNAYTYSLEVTCPAVRFDGNTPNVGGADLLDQELPFKCLDDASGTTPVQMVYRTSDATP